MADRYTDRQINTPTDIQTDRYIDRQLYRHIQIHRQINRNAIRNMLCLLSLMMNAESLIHMPLYLARTDPFIIHQSRIFKAISNVTAVAANLTWIFKRKLAVVSQKHLGVTGSGKWLLPLSRWMFPKCFRLTTAIFLLEIQVRSAFKIDSLEVVEVSAPGFKDPAQNIISLINCFSFNYQHSVQILEFRIFQYIYIKSKKLISFFEHLISIHVIHGNSATFFL